MARDVHLQCYSRGRRSASNDSKEIACKEFAWFMELLERSAPKNLHEEMQQLRDSQSNRRCY
jgi:hypothetical protein